MTSKKKILMIIPGMNHSDGVCTFAMNVYRNINHDLFSIDFLVHKPQLAPDYKKTIEENNDSIYYFGTLKYKNFINLRKQFLSLLRQKQYDAVHCNLPNMAFLYLGLSKKTRVPIRILHSHATRLADVFSHRIRNSILYAFGKNKANVRLACSDMAGISLFKRKNFTTVYNGMDFDRFRFNISERNRIRSSLGLEENDILLGQVGRICPQKNQAFSIQVLNELPSNYHLLCIGSSENDYLHSLPISDNTKERVIFLPPQEDIENYYSAFDFFVLPSEYEGLPFSLVEAQSSGLICFASDTITTESNIGSSIFLPLDKAKWIDKISTLSHHYEHQNHYSAKFDMKTMIASLEKIYSSSLL